MPLFKTTTKIIHLMDEFYSTLDKGVLTFRSGIKYYLVNNSEQFRIKLEEVTKLESKADKYRRDIENRLYVHSILPQYRGDIMRLLEASDDIIDLVKENMYQFDIETPKIPQKLKHDVSKLVEMSVMAAEALVPAAKSYFMDVHNVKSKLHRVLFYEREADKLANFIKRKIFKEMDNLNLSQKSHLRYFVKNIEAISDAAELVADILGIMAIKRIN